MTDTTANKEIPAVSTTDLYRRAYENLMAKLTPEQQAKMLDPSKRDDKDVTAFAREVIALAEKE